MPQPELLQQIHNQPPVTPADNQAPVALAHNQAPVPPVDNQAQVTPLPPQLQAPPSDTPAPSKPAAPQYKNHLQEYTQKEGLPLPVYQTVFDGALHSLMFRSTVLVNGAFYASSTAFPTRKAAEMDAARTALISVPQHEENCSINQEELTLCKAILKEYADKINAENPNYNTEKGDGSHLAFISSLTFNGKQYVGEEGRNKKESQHLAARAVILSILDSDARGVISKIIKSKKKMLCPAKVVNKPCNAQNVDNPGRQTTPDIVPNTSTENEPVVVNDNMIRTAMQEPCNSSSGSAEPVTLVQASVPLNVEQLIIGSTSSKKRKRKAKKAENKVGIDALVQVAAVPSSPNTTSTDYSDRIREPNSCVSLPGTDNAAVPLSQNTSSMDNSDRICVPNSCISQPGSDNAVLSET